MVYGELRNNRGYFTFGILALRGDSPESATVVRLDLTGNCGKDLHGKAFRFRPSGDPQQGPVFREDEHPGFQIRQIGPTATMTAQDWVRALPCSVEEYVHRSKLGEPLPTKWARRLYLEWYSQNGRVVVEMAGPIVEECTREPKGQDDEGEWAPLPNLALPPDERPTGGPDITLIRLDDDGNAQVEHIEPPDPHDERDTASESLLADLQRVLDAEASAIDRVLQDDESGIAEHELMDHCIQHGERQPIDAMLGDFRKLPPPEDLDDRALEVQLKSVLGRLAMIGVALGVCEHYTPRDCYRLLRDTILPDEKAYEELVGTGWVQNFSTHEYCRACDAEFEERWAREHNAD